MTSGGARCRTCGVSASRNRGSELRNRRSITFPVPFQSPNSKGTAILLSSPLLTRETVIMSDMEYALAPIWGFVLVIFTMLVSAIFWIWVSTFVYQYSLEAQHLRVKLFGMFCISSIPYQGIKEVRVIPWWREYWKEDWQHYFLTLHWAGYALRRTRVLIATKRSRFPYTLISPADSVAFSAALSARIPKTI